MPIDNLFKDCEVIAEKYEKHLIDVIIEYGHIEMLFKSQMIDLSYDELIKKTDESLKQKYIPSPKRMIHGAI